MKQSAQPFSQAGWFSLILSLRLSPLCFFCKSPTLQLILSAAIVSPAQAQSARYALILDGAVIARYASLAQCESARQRTMRELTERLMADVRERQARAGTGILIGPPVIPRSWCVLVS